MTDSIADTPDRHPRRDRRVATTLRLLPEDHRALAQLALDLGHWCAFHAPRGSRPINPPAPVADDGPTALDILTMFADDGGVSR